MTRFSLACVVLPFFVIRGEDNCGGIDVQIKKILNNNVIVTTDDDGCEVVAMGCGIAFGKHNGSTVPRAAIDKIYRLNDHDMLEKFKELLSDLSLEYLDASNAIIDLAERELQTKLNENIYISLTDHIHMAVLRIKSNIPIRNMMLWEIRRYYPKEFAVAEKAVDILNDTFDIQMPEDEAGFIAMHLIDAQMDLQIPLADKVVKLIEEITSIVRITCRIEFDQESLAYYRFITHLKFFAQRLFSHTTSKAEEIDDEMDQMIQNRYPLAHSCVEKIAAFLARKYHYALSGDEQFYLTIHIAKVIQSH